MTDTYVGADIAAIAKEAVMAALREFLASGITDEHLSDTIKNIVVTKRHFEAAIKVVKPTSTPGVQQEFEEKAEDLVKHAYA